MLLYKFDLLDAFKLTEDEVISRAKQSMLDTLDIERHFKPGWELKLVKRIAEGSESEEEIIRYSFEVHGEYEEDSAPFVGEEAQDYMSIFIAILDKYFSWLKKPLNKFFYWLEEK